MATNNQSGNKGNNQSDDDSRSSGRGGEGNNQSGTSNRGFASMDPEQQREIAAEGGRAAHASGNAHEFTSEEAREAGKLSHGGNRQSGADSGSSSGSSSGSNKQSDSKSSKQSDSGSNKQSDDSSSGKRSGSQSNRDSK